MASCVWGFTTQSRAGNDNNMTRWHRGGGGMVVKSSLHRSTLESTEMIIDIVMMEKDTRRHENRIHNFLFYFLKNSWTLKTSWLNRMSPMDSIRSGARLSSSSPVRASGFIVCYRPSLPCHWPSCGVLPSRSSPSSPFGSQRPFCVSWMSSSSTFEGYNQFVMIQLVEF